MSSAQHEEQWASRIDAVFKYNVITWEEDLAAAKAEGFRDGLASALRGHLELRLERLPDWLDRYLEQASQQELDSWIDRVLDAERLEDVFSPQAEAPH